MQEYDPDRVVLQVACTDYEAGSALVADMLGNMAKMAGAEPRLASGTAEPALGWTFYALSVDKSFVRRLADLPEIGIMHMKGATLDQKFAVWLNRQLQARVEGVRVELLSDLHSSRFGLF
ncbi:MAG TPA: hypothetical protein VFZ05_01150 [Nitrososphaera sp.]